MFFGGSPFEQFAGMHGGDGGGRRGPAPDVDTNEMYTILGIEKNATEGDIKKAYRKLALKVIDSSPLAGRPSPRCGGLYCYLSRWLCFSGYCVLGTYPS